MCKSIRVDPTGEGGDGHTNGSISWGDHYLEQKIKTIPKPIINQFCWQWVNQSTPSLVAEPVKASGTARTLRYFSAVMLASQYPKRNRAIRLFFDFSAIITCFRDSCLALKISLLLDHLLVTSASFKAGRHYWPTSSCYLWLRLLLPILSPLIT